MSEDEDNLSVPAGPIRVTFGLIAMPLGLFIVALSESSWAKFFGFILFLVAPFIMLRRPPKSEGDQ